MYAAVFPFILKCKISFDSVFRRVPSAFYLEVN